MAYNGRTGPNVSEYIANLNAIPSELPNDDDFNLDDSLAMFTNTQFYDFDAAEGHTQEGAVAPDTVGDMSMDFMNGEQSFRWSLLVYCLLSTVWVIRCSIQPDMSGLYRLVLCFVAFVASVAF